MTPLPLAPKGKPGGPLMITYHPLHHRLERPPARWSSMWHLFRRTTPDELQNPRLRLGVLLCWDEHHISCHICKLISNRCYQTHERPQPHSKAAAEEASTSNCSKRHRQDCQPLLPRCVLHPLMPLAWCVGVYEPPEPCRWLFYCYYQFGK